MAVVIHSKQITFYNIESNKISILTDVYVIKIWTKTGLCYSNGRIFYDLLGCNKSEIAEINSWILLKVK